MNERDYLDHHTKRTADNVTATIESANDDGTYMVKTIGPRALRRASTANPLDKFKKGQRVIISELSATRNVLGTEAVIQSRAPRDQRGLSETTPAESRNSHNIAYILSVDPDPLVLTAGGAGEEQEIIGRGFAEAAEYVDDDGNPITLDEVDAPVVTDTKVTMSVAAPQDAPRGEFAARIGTATAKKALRIVPNVTPSLYVWTFEDPDPPRMFRLHPVTLETIHVYEVPNGNYGEFVGQAGDVLIGLTSEGSSASSNPWPMLLLNLRTDMQAPAPNQAHGNFGYGGAVIEGEVWTLKVGGGNLELVKIRQDGTTESDVMVFGWPVAAPDPTPNVAQSHVYGAAHDRIFSHAVETGTTAVALTVPTDAGVQGDRMAVTLTGVWAIGANGFALKFNKDTLALIHNIDLGTGFGKREVVFCRGKVFACVAVGGSTLVYEIDDATGAFTLVATVAGVELDWLEAGTDAIYITAEDQQAVYRMDATTYAVTSATPDNSAGVLGLGPSFVSRRVR